MMASELLRFGPARAGELLAALTAWMTGHEYVSIELMQGRMSQK